MTDEKIQSLLARVMVGGVIISGIIIFSGLTWYLATHIGVPPGDHVFSGEPKYFESFGGMIRRAFSWHEFGERRSVIMVGIVLLLFNPIVRVGLAVAGFFAQRDWQYCAISALVFAVLVFSFFA
ncbi:hypothetical protein TSACC_2363 [Terrimicrobium sacchariphilum]|jgi:uncharacterized membrane protein|uniref:DUF1634 domain-containing protein n=1 Tax=Terrimicrobium sacchariphilum TaxID=690879 RepID=A0A146G5D6_TERSA|nr:DUF1634 domain-containing protein [Terrimicrobium sacchariphilum]GAT31966.1 hypothetical protein TSACC_2363 [Terrimicrobium sacchariphilum]